MKMVSMEKKYNKKDNMPKETIGVDMDYSEKYPYGLRIDLQKDQVDKIPELKNCKVGDMVNIMGYGKIVAVRMAEMHGKDTHNVEIQIEKIAVDKKKSLEQMNQKEYNDARKQGKGYM